MLSHSDAGQAAIRAGVLRVGGDRLAEGRERLVVIEVVDVVGGLGAERLGLRVGRAPAPRAASEQHGAAERRGRLPGRVIRPILRRAVRLAPLVPSAYNRLRLWTTPALQGVDVGQRGEHADVRTGTRTTHEHHEELGFWRKYVFSLDHKVIGIQYAITGLLFLLFGFTLMMIMRWQLAYPGRPIPLIGSWLGPGPARRAASCCPSSTTSSARCTAPSWCSSASCRSPSAASATS